jgi:hypothetical protein
MVFLFLFFLGKTKKDSTKIYGRASYFLTSMTRLTRKREIRKEASCASQNKAKTQHRRTSNRLKQMRQLMLIPNNPEKAKVKLTIDHMAPPHSAQRHSA